MWHHKPSARRATARARQRRLAAHCLVLGKPQLCDDRQLLQLAAHDGDISLTAATTSEQHRKALPGTSGGGSGSSFASA